MFAQKSHLFVCGFFNFFPYRLHLKKKERNSPFLNLLWYLNLLLSALFMLSVAAGYIPPSKFPFLSVLGLVFPLLLFANLLFLLFWLTVRRKSVLLSLGVLLLAFPSVARHFGFSLSNTSISGKKIKIISYNVQGFSHSNDAHLKEAAKQDIFTFLVAQNPDIVCLQEYRSKDKNLYKPLKHDKQTLHSGTHFFQSYFGPGNENLTGMIIFSKFPSAGSGYLKFNGQRTFAVYTDLIVGHDTVRVINVHLASIGLSTGDLEMISTGGIDQTNEISRSKRIYYKLVKAYKLHEKQMNAVMELAAGTKGKVLLCGDFNDTPGSYVYNLISNLFSDLFLKRGAGMSPTYAGPLPFLRIDYIFFNGSGILPVSYRRFKIRFSDHYPVAAELVFKK